MRAVVQRVSKASVSVGNDIVGKINKGLLVLLGIGGDDNQNDLEYMVDKILGLRIFQDENDKMNLSLLDIEGEILIVSQFTLYGDARKGRRPSFSDSAAPEMAEKMYLDFVEKCKDRGLNTQTGVFAADMDVDLTNQGPVTILLDSKKIF